MAEQQDDEAQQSCVNLVPKVGDDIAAPNARWSFGGKVADTFETHIERSVPDYRRGHALLAALSDYFLHDGAVALELGCSTGALLRQLAEHHHGRDIRFVGQEIVEPMVENARKNCARFGNIDIQHADILSSEFEAADLIISYYTIQFVRPAQRQMLIDKIYRSLNWGGAFIMFEKVRGPDARFQDIMSTLYTDFKLEQGFDEKEIVHKTRSLKGTLEPFSTKGNYDMIHRAGFVDVMTVFKHICFEGFFAIK